ncbi:MAG: hotdog domain-containing protein [Solirubrobacteraceae bacterium]
MFVEYGRVGDPEHGAPWGLQPGHRLTPGLLTPRVSLHLEFRRLLRFGDEAWITLSVAAVGRTSLRYSPAVTDLEGHP